jgi:hypothetical protein
MRFMAPISRLPKAARNGGARSTGCHAERVPSWLHSGVTILAASDYAADSEQQ